MTNELQFRKDIIAGFAFIIENWCFACDAWRKMICKDSCLKFKAASAGHLNIINEMKAKEDAEG